MEGHNDDCGIEIDAMAMEGADDPECEDPSECTCWCHEKEPDMDVQLKDAKLEI